MSKLSEALAKARTPGETQAHAVGKDVAGLSIADAHRDYGPASVLEALIDEVMETSKIHQENGNNSKANELLSLRADLGALVRKYAHINGMGW